MKKMYRIALFVAILAAPAFAQTDAPAAEKPPAELERTVLTRVNEFYALMLKHQYRPAESYIAEDTKDYYYGGAKPDISKYEVMSVEFSDHFTRARALTRCTEPVVVAGFPPGDMTVTVPSLWKLENGNWYLYEDPEKISNPSGLRTKIQKTIDATAAANTAAPPMPSELPKDPSFALGKLQADKQEVKLAAGAVEKITISNSSAGPVTLEPGYPLPGVDAKLDRTEVGKGEKAVLTLTAGKEPSGGFYYLRILPTGEAIRIDVRVQ
jgi:hypothetical protein